jgi:molecular chaperone DnaK (HSP70)
MLEKSEEYAKEDSVDRAHFESQSKLEDYTYSLKRQYHDLVGFGGCIKVNGDDKKSFLSAIQHTEDWLDQNAANAVVGEFDKQLEKLSSKAVPVITRATRQSWWRWYCW